MGVLKPLHFDFRRQRISRTVDPRPHNTSSKSALVDRSCAGPY